MPAFLHEPTSVADVEARIKDAVTRCKTYRDESSFKFIMSTPEKTREDATVFAEVLRAAIERFCEIVAAPLGNDAITGEPYLKADVDVEDVRNTVFLENERVKEVLHIFHEELRETSMNPLHEFIVYGAIVTVLSTAFYETTPSKEELWAPDITYLSSMERLFTVKYDLVEVVPLIDRVHMI